jgi:RecG-like helicase
VCLLMVSNGLSEKALSRLQIMTESQDGFEIAQKDLEERGQGELIGMRQAGLGELDLSEMMKSLSLFLGRRKRPMHCWMPIRNCRVRVTKVSKGLWNPF